MVVHKIDVDVSLTYSKVLLPISVVIVQLVCFWSAAKPAEGFIHS
jgi:hypothetical protein